MKIKGINDSRIVVALSDEDMRELDITYDEMDYQNIETRRVIWTVLDKAQQSLGKPISTDGRLLIEVNPTESGGCTMCFTVIPQHNTVQSAKPVMHKGTEPLIFCADDENACIDAYKRLKAESSKTDGVECCSFCGKIYFIIRPKPMQAAFLACILGDYGEVLTDNRAAAFKLREHGEAPAQIISGVNP